MHQLTDNYGTFFSLQAEGILHQGSGDSYGSLIWLAHRTARSIDTHRPHHISVGLGLVEGGMWRRNGDHADGRAQLVANGDGAGEVCIILIVSSSE